MAFYSICICACGSFCLSCLSHFPKKASSGDPLHFKMSFSGGTDVALCLVAYVRTLNHFEQCDRAARALTFPSLCRDSKISSPHAAAHSYRISSQWRSRRLWTRQSHSVRDFVKLSVISETDSASSCEVCVRACLNTAQHIFCSILFFLFLALTSTIQLFHTFLLLSSSSKGQMAHLTLFFKKHRDRYAA